MWEQSGGLKRTEDCDFLQNVREYKMRTDMNMNMRTASQV